MKLVKNINNVNMIITNIVNKKSSYIIYIYYINIQQDTSKLRFNVHYDNNTKLYVVILLI